MRCFMFWLVLESWFGKLGVQAVPPSEASSERKTSGAVHVIISKRFKTLQNCTSFLPLIANQEDADPRDVTVEKFIAQN
jgi:hypothetical protein